jgi:glucokinase
MARAIGVDLGGTHVMAAVVDEDGTIKNRHEVDIVDHRLDAVVEAMESAINGALSDVKNSSVVGIGVGSPGNIDARTGMIRWSPNFHWTNVPLGDRLPSSFN